jgi:four helix bundle protein
VTTPAQPTPERPDIEGRTYQLALRVVRLCRQLDEQPGVSRTLGKQLLRSGTSIGANVKEAHAGQSRADFVSKMAIALKEARETRYWLRLLSDSGVIPPPAVGDLLGEATEVMRILGAIVATCRRNDATRR